MGNSNFEIEESTLTTDKTEIRRPSLFKVLLHNDDYTPMDFVVMILETIFNKSHEDSVQIMLSVHQSGIGNCGVYTYEVAEIKKQKVLQISKENEYPLKCSIEREG